MEEKLDRIVEDIRKKKELRHLQSSYVLKCAQEYLAQNPAARKFVQETFQLRSGKYKQIIKEVRSRLRRRYGLFQENGSGNPSTAERREFYPELFSKIFSVTGKPTSFLDLGCGQNPFFVKLMRLKKIKYYAYDIDEKLRDNLQRFFDQVHAENKSFQGRAEVLDITRPEAIKKIPAADVCFLFKVTDVLDQGKGHKNTEEIVKVIPARYTILSFPTLTMSGKRMNAPRRQWVEWMCTRLGYPCTVLEFSSEIFYIIKKKG